MRVGLLVLPRNYTLGFYTEETLAILHANRLVRGSANVCRADVAIEWADGCLCPAHLMHGVIGFDHWKLDPRLWRGN